MSARPKGSAEGSKGPGKKATKGSVPRSRSSSRTRRSSNEGNDRRVQPPQTSLTPMGPPSKTPKGSSPLSPGEKEGQSSASQKSPGLKKSGREKRTPQNPSTSKKTSSKTSAEPERDSQGFAKPVPPSPIAGRTRGAQKRKKAGAQTSAGSVSSKKANPVNKKKPATKQGERSPPSSSTSSSKTTKMTAEIDPQTPPGAKKTKSRIKTGDSANPNDLNMAQALNSNVNRLDYIFNQFESWKNDSEKLRRIARSHEMCEDRLQRELKAKKVEFEKKLRNLQNERDGERTVSARSLKECQSNLEKLENKCKALENDKEREMVLHRQTQKKMVGIEREFETLKMKHDSLVQIRDELVKKNRELNHRQCQEDVEGLKRKIQMMDQQLADMEKSFEKRKAKFDSVWMAEKRGLEENWTRRIQGLEKRCLEYQKLAESTQNDLEETRQDKIRLTDRLKNTQMKLEKSEEKCAEMRQRLLETSREKDAIIQDLEKKHEKMLGNFRQQHKVVEALEDENEDLHTEIEYIQDKCTQIEKRLGIPTLNPRPFKRRRRATEGDSLYNPGMGPSSSDDIKNAMNDGSDGNVPVLHLDAIPSYEKGEEYKFPFAIKTIQFFGDWRGIVLVQSWNRSIQINGWKLGNKDRSSTVELPSHKIFNPGEEIHVAFGFSEKPTDLVWKLPNEWDVDTCTGEEIYIWDSQLPPNGQILEAISANTLKSSYYQGQREESQSPETIDGGSQRDSTCFIM